jgi:GntR family transcriptional repressor for pyruvate dehydrogenase complex
MDHACGPVPQTTIRRIQEMIRSGELQRGNALPPQRVLSERLSVSRASLREALSALATIGLLRTEPRRGTFVVDPEAPDGKPMQAWRFSRHYSPLEVYQFRFVTEGHAAGLAARHVSSAELAALRHNLKDFKDAVRETDLVASSQLDFAFHRLVMAASRNRVLADLLESQRLPLARQQRLWEPVVEHENIVRALQRRDPDGATYFMHVHLMRAANRVGVALSEAA